MSVVSFILVKQLRRQVALSVLILSCLAMPAFVQTSLGLLQQGVESSVLDQTKPLLGGDIEITTETSLSLEKRRTLVDLLEDYGGQLQSRIIVAVKVGYPNDRIKNVKLIAISEKYPFYGKFLVTDGNENIQFPAKILADEQQVYIKTNSWVVSDMLGAMVTIAGKPFPVRGMVTESPELPLSLVPSETKLYISLENYQELALETGAQYAFTTWIKLDNPQKSEVFKAQLMAQWNDSTTKEDYSIVFEQRELKMIRTLHDFEETLSSTLGRIVAFMKMLRVVVFWLSLMGMYMVIRLSFNNEMASVSILKALGMSRQLIAREIMLRYGCLGAIGAIVGVSCGVLICHMFMSPLMTITIGFKMILWLSMLIVCSTGLCMGIGWLTCWKVLPNTAMDLMRFHKRGIKAILNRSVIEGLLFISLTFIVFWLQMSTSFGGLLLTASIWGVVVIFSVIVGTSLVIVKKVFQGKGPFPLRYGISNLGRRFRSRALTMSLIAVSIFLVGLLMIYKSNLTKMVFPDNQQFSSSSLFLSNIKANQKEEVETFFSKEQQERIVLKPITQGYLQGINGKSIALLMKDLNPRTERYQTLTSEKILSYNTNSSQSATIIKGRRVVDSASEVTVSTHISRVLGLSIGDSLEVSIQEKRIIATLVGITEVDKNQYETNAFMVFSKQLFEQSEITWGGWIEQPTNRSIQTKMAQQFPNSIMINNQDTTFKISTVLNAYLKSLYGIHLVLLIMGLLIVTVVVIVYEQLRRQELTLLSLMGCSRWWLVSISFWEYTVLAFMPICVGLLVSVGVGRVMVHRWQEFEWVIPWGHLLMLGFGSYIVILAITLPYAWVKAKQRKCY